MAPRSARLVVYSPGERATRCNGKAATGRTALLVSLALTLAGVSLQPAQALDPTKAISQYALEIWQIEDGLPQDSLTAVTQTADGALWLGTPAGLVRFDGSEFSPTVEPPGWAPAERYIASLATAADGSLYATTRASLIHTQGGRLHRFAAGAGIANGAAALLELSDRSLLLATDDGVLHVRDGRAQPLSPPPRGLASALALARSADGTVWVGGDGGLHSLGGQPERRYTAADGLPSALVTTLVPRPNGGLWIGTSLGLVILDPDGHLRQPAGAESLRGQWIRCLTLDRDGSLWIGIRGGGAHRFANGRLAPFGVREGLPNGIVRQIFEDRDGALWFATAGGLARLEDGAVRTWSSPEGLTVPFVWAVHEDPAGRLWVGTSGGGVAEILASGRVAPGVSHPGLAGTEVRAFLTDHRGRLWIGTNAQGLYVVEGGRPRAVAAASLGNLGIFCLLEDTANRLWVGTGRGLYLLRGDRSGESSGESSDEESRESSGDRSADESGEESGNWAGAELVGPVALADGSAPLQVRSLAEDGRGGLWVGTIRGLYNLTADALRDPLLVPAAGASALAATRIHHIFVDAEPPGVASSLAAPILWLATDGGLARLADGRLLRLTTREGLPNDMLYWVLDDGNGNLWLSSDVGVLRLPRAQFAELERGAQSLSAPAARSELHLLPLGRADGMRGTECNSGHPAGVRRRSGALCFATTDGVACVDPRRPDTPADPPVAQLRDLLLDGVATSLDTGFDTDFEHGLEPDVEPRLETTLASGPASAPLGPASGPANGAGLGPSLAPSSGSATGPGLGPGTVRHTGPRAGLDAGPEASRHAAHLAAISTSVRRIEIRYGAIALWAPEKVHFRYRMEGFDTTWVSPLHGRSASFTGLDPGRYRFVVEAQRGDGPWGPADTLELTITPAFHQTTGFYLLVASGLLLAVGGGVRWRTRQLRRAERRLRDLVAERTADLVSTSEDLAARSRDLERANAELERLSLLDGLTRIANRRHFDARLDSEWRRAARADGPVSLLLADIDWFKAYNDDCGHLAGDDCLRRVAEQAANCAQRAEDLVARYGGEELAILLPGTESEAAVILAEKLRLAVEALAIDHPQAPDGRITLSVGVATRHPLIESDPHLLVAAADTALYRAKAAGRNRVSR